MPGLALKSQRVEKRWADRSAVVRGSGVAALTCARLLGVQGWDVRLELGAPARRRHVLLGAATARLLAALWDEPMLLAGTHPIRERAVSWGTAPDIDILPAPGIALDIDDLVRRLAEGLCLPPGGADATGDAAWIVDTRPDSADSSGADPPMHVFGGRHAWISQVELRADSRDDLCVMESVADGWAFLLPVGGGLASLQFVSIPSGVPPLQPAEVAAATRVIRDAIGHAGAWSDPIPCMPRARLPPASVGRLAVGEGALAFDPISGDGVGHALRGVVLAATTLHEIASGKETAECLDDYANILRRAMVQHIRACLDLYGDAPLAAAWQDEIRAMKDGVALLTQMGGA